MKRTIILLVFLAMVSLASYVQAGDRFEIGIRDYTVTKNGESVTDSVEAQKILDSAPGNFGAKAGRSQPYQVQGFTTPQKQLSQTPRPSAAQLTQQLSQRPAPSSGHKINLQLPPGVKPGGKVIRGRNGRLYYQEPGGRCLLLSRKPAAKAKPKTNVRSSMAADFTPAYLPKGGTIDGGVKKYLDGKVNSQKVAAQNGICPEQAKRLPENFSYGLPTKHLKKGESGYDHPLERIDQLRVERDQLRAQITALEEVKEAQGELIEKLQGSLKEKEARIQELEKEKEALKKQFDELQKKSQQPAPTQPQQPVVKPVPAPQPTQPQEPAVTPTPAQQTAPPQAAPPAKQEPPAQQETPAAVPGAGLKKIPGCYIETGLPQDHRG